ncbi:MAG: hypothetical protein APR53_04640 [Methanoculleus sp. SDB]|nr:MAG: hypothetical protein APR53_04640 [Methanoculleus sp. SDB]
MEKSKYIVTIATETERNEWDAIVRANSHASPFHLWEWMHVDAAWSGAQLYPLIVSVGTTIVGLYPVFIMNRWTFLCGFSPPPGTATLYLGPVIADYEGLKQKKRESRYIGVQNAVDHFLFTQMHCHFVRLFSPPGLEDARPYQWAGYNVDPHYTYRLDLSSGEKAVWQRIDRRTRDSINRAVRNGVVVTEGGYNQFEEIVRSVRKSLIRQGTVRVTDEGYYRDLYAAFSSGMIRIFSAEYQGEQIGGMIALHFGGRLYQWIGLQKSDFKSISPNDLVSWEAIRWACRKGCSTIEIMDGGDNQRLRFFKSKYNPDLHIWFSAVRYSSPVYQIIKTIYDCLI